MQKNLFRRKKGARYLGAGLTLLLGIVAFNQVEQVNAAELPWQPGQLMVGKEQHMVAKSEYTFVDLGEEYNFGLNELIQANPGIDAWLPNAGDQILLPGRFILPEGDLDGIVVNLPEFRLYYFQPEKGRVLTYPIGVGTAEFPTPIMDTKVKMGLESPTWYPPQSIRSQRLKEFGEVLPAAIPAGPDNPLGSYALLLGANGYLIHGTNKAVGIGMRVSHGCIRLYNWDIESLVAAAKNNTRVRIVKQPVKLALAEGQIWAELHLDSEDTPQQRRRHFINALSGLKVPPSAYDLNAEQIERMLLDNSGTPQVVGVLSELPPSLAVKP